MREYRLLIDGRPVADVRIAATYAQRLRGLLGTDASSAPLLLSPANSVHGWGMRYALDIAQLSGDRPLEPSGPAGSGGWLTVVRVASLRPGGLVGPRRGVKHVLEAPGGTFTKWELTPGSRVALCDS